MPVSRIYLSPGLFGFDRLASFDYFCHVERGLRRRFRARGLSVEMEVIDVHPTASIRRRAMRLAQVIEKTAQRGDWLHLLGHSTGGLDARLVASPNAQVIPGQGHGRAAWMNDLRSVTTMNTPHFGTPIATFFATSAGQRLLSLLSALTVIALQLGAPPLTVMASLIATVSRWGDPFGLNFVVPDRLVDTLVRTLDDTASREVRAYLRQLRDDQGAIVQLTPEAMDLFHTGIEDHPGVRYQCAISHAPGGNVAHWASTLLAPWKTVSAAIFALVQGITATDSSSTPSP